MSEVPTGSSLLRSRLRSSVGTTQSTRPPFPRGSRTPLRERSDGQGHERETEVRPSPVGVKYRLNTVVGGFDRGREIG